jgi:hypothetical protein
LKPAFDRSRLRWLWKLLFFNAVILAMYWLLMNFLGMAELAEDWAELGFVLTAVMLVLGNLTFFMLDVVLGRKIRRKR